MRNKNANRFLMSAVAVVAAGSMVSASRADTVNLDTSVGSNWTVARVTSPTLSFAAVTPVTTSFPLSAWVAASTVNATQTAIDNQPHNAVWVSDAIDGGG